MSILSALPLGKIIGAGFAGMVIASPFAIKHLSNYSSSSEEEEEEEEEKGEANCWLVMQGTDQKEAEKEKQLIVCKDSAEGGVETGSEESQTPKVKYYLRPEADNVAKKEVKSIKVTNSNIVSITLAEEIISVPSAAGGQESIQITRAWNLGNNLTFGSDCQIDWQAKNGYKKKLTCTPTRSSGQYKWLDPIYN